MNFPSVEAGPVRGRPPFRELSVFVLIVCGLAWLVFTPVLLNGASPSDPAFVLASQLFMFTPAVAALLVTFLLWRPGNVRRALGLTPLRPVRRVGGYTLLAFAVFVLLPAVTLLTAVVFGVVRLDLEDFSGLREELTTLAPEAAATMPRDGFPLEAYLVVLGMVAVSFVPTLLMCFGEELGWRGYLLPRLLPLGVWPALLVSGVVHGLWHGPQLLIHSLSGSFGLGDVLTFLTSVVLLGVVLGWLRLASRSVWPAVVGHAANNAFVLVIPITLMHADGPSGPGLYPGGNGGLIGLAVMALAALVITLLLRKGIAGAT
ncbi:CPBP family intramembrane glutamic endopeptidase [Nocardiopsis alba]|jgi:membrane protease YdiL (CAAX protease family)|uniref:CPBP family intramembrane glutamic endopeptidase n=1 Tax=Nocardiopsis alba TaxID=53437 RepID=UPI00034C9FE1|nr:CPBP family intramembrane glutamic endopeptidase [Nocardiopsis alba]